MTNIPALHTTVTGSGPGILLAHGATGSIADNYAALAPALAAAGHTVVAPGYPGSGETPRATAPLTLDGLADAVVERAVAAGVETFTLVGFSLGTAVSVRAAARHPERVRGLVLTAGLARPDRHADITLGLWAHLLERGDHAAFARSRTLTGWSRRHLNGLPQAEADALLTPDPALWPAGSAEQTALVRTVDTTGDLPGIAVPTLVVATTEDELLHPSHSRYLADHIPGAEYAEIAAGHVVMHERYAEWEELILDFLRRHAL
ncbi:alpha/beta fold hydrolase [Streptomyces sp. NPDC001262]|uniref:alpha/beta fold hydrolase n=1 Tax=Streptomyces sp. NPDC001262 TaxID=3364552 RepID=UPI00368CAC7E